MLFVNQYVIHVTVYGFNKFELFVDFKKNAFLVAKRESIVSHFELQSFLKKQSYNGYSSQPYLIGDRLINYHVRLM